VRLICPEEPQDPGADGHNFVLVILQLFSCVFFVPFFFPMNLGFLFLL
jgi:hypothetical protein